MLHKALELNEALGHREGMAINYSSLGNVYRIQGALDQAEAMYHKALSLFQETGATVQVEQVRPCVCFMRKAQWTVERCVLRLLLQAFILDKILLPRIANLGCDGTARHEPLWGKVGPFSLQIARPL